MTRMRSLLAAALLVSASGALETRTWSSNGYGDVSICLDETKCGLFNTTLSLNTLNEYDITGVSGPYYFTMTTSVASLVFGGETPDVCGASATCTLQSTEAVLPNGGVPYSTPASNGDPVLRMSVFEVDSGAVSELVGGVGAALPTPLTTGDIMFSFEFENWSLMTSDSTLNVVFRVKTFTDGSETNSVYAYSPDGNIIRLVLGSGIYADLPRVSDVGGTPTYTALSWTMPDSSSVNIVVSLPAGSLVKYSFAMWFVPLPTTSSPSSSSSSTSSSASTSTSTSTSTSGSSASGSASTASSALVPASVLNLFSGGFEFCAAANCNINAGVLSMALDRLGTAPILSNTLEFGTLVTDFTVEDNLPFSDPVSVGTFEIHPLILQISRSGSVTTYKNSSKLLSGSLPDEDNSYVVVAVARLEEEDSMTIMGEKLTAPAGALRVSLSGYIAPNLTLPLTSFGLSFFLFAMEDGGVVTDVTSASINMYTRSINISDMYILYSVYGTADGDDYPMNVQQHAYTSGDDEGLIELLFQFSASQSFEYEFYIGSKNIEYATAASSPSRSASGSDAPVVTGITNGPNVSATDGKPIPTKLLALPHGEFGLCFDTSCTTSAVKVGFSGLASTEGGHLGRFSNAAAFDFSDPEHLYTATGAEVWSMSFKALVPQSRVRPPIPFDSTLAASHPTFSVRVDQYLTAGHVTKAGASLSVPRGALKFSFEISNWSFQSISDRIVMNVTLSSIVGAVPGSSSLTVAGMIGNIIRISFGNEQFLDVPLLAEFDGRSGNVGISPVVETDVGVVLVMEFGFFEAALAYDPVLASQSLLVQNINLRTPVTRKVMYVAAITLTAILGLLILAAAVRCLRKVPTKLDLHSLLF